MEAVALTTREHTDELLLVGTGKVEARQVCAGIHLATTHAEGLLTARNNLVYALFGVDILVSLVNVGNLHGLTYIEATLVYLLLLHNEAEECSFTRTVGTYHTYDTIGRQHKVEVVKEKFLAIGLGNALRFDNLITQAGTVGNKDFELLLALFLILIEESVV